MLGYILVFWGALKLVFLVADWVNGSPHKMKRIYKGKYDTKQNRQYYKY